MTAPPHQYIPVLRQRVDQAVDVVLIVLRVRRNAQVVVPARHDNPITLQPFHQQIDLVRLHRDHRAVFGGVNRLPFLCYARVQQHKGHHLAPLERGIQFRRRRSGHALPVEIEGGFLPLVGFVRRDADDQPGQRRQAVRLAVARDIVQICA